MDRVAGKQRAKEGRVKGDRARGLNKLLLGALVGLGGAVLAIALSLSGSLELFELKSWDVRVRLLARPGAATDRIALILLDQKSLDWASETMGLPWPWPRETYAAVTRFCQRAGAKALAFDVLYTEPSAYGVYDDQSFGAAVADFGRVVACVNLSDEEGSARRWPPEIPRPELELENPATWRSGGVMDTLTFSRATFPIPELAASARLLANVNLTRAADLDGVYRRAPLFGLFDGTALPTVGLATFLAARAGTAALRLGPGSAALGDLEIPVDRAGRVLLRYRGPLEVFSRYSAAAVIQSEIQLESGQSPTIDPETLRDRYVLFGFSAPGLYDLRSSPVSGTYPGVAVHATLLDNLLSADFMKDTPLWAAVILTMALTVGAGIASVHASGTARSVAVYVVFLALPLGLSLGGYALGRWLPLLMTEVGAVATLVSGGLLNYATEGRQKRYLKSAFRQYLSPTVIEELIAHPERLKLGGERRELSIFFSDLQGFTGISEGLTPEELTALLNDYLSAMTDIIQEEGGTIDKYEGDAIIAFWNAPVDQPDHAVRAVRSALRCQKRLAELRPAFRDRVGKELLMRIGLNSGPAVVGNMGSHTRFDYTMLGDAVNLASRLEGTNKQFRTYTMVSAATVERTASAFPVRELGRVAVVGRKEPVVVYEPMFPEELEARRALLDSFASALSAYYTGRFAEAAELFARTAAEDPPAASYVEKCRELEASPPDGRWDGVWVMTSK
jgi:adenylate cyclase